MAALDSLSTILLNNYGLYGCEAPFKGGRGRTELRGCVKKVEVDVLESPSLTVFNMVSVDVKLFVRVQELCESGGIPPGLPVPNSP